MKKIIILLVASLFLFTSCKSPCEISKRKIEKIEAKCPDALVKTITIIDTIVTPPEIITDTMWVTKPIDTISLVKDNFIIKIRRIHDTIILDSLVYQHDTIVNILEKEIPITVLKEKESFISKVQKVTGEITLTIVGLIAVYFGIKILRRYFKPV